ARGGTISGLSGQVSLSVQAGATTRDTAVFIDRATGVGADPRLVAGTAVSLTPESLTLSSPGVLILRGVASVPAASADQLRIYQWTTGRWLAVSGSTATSGAVVAPI